MFLLAGCKGIAVTDAEASPPFLCTDCQDGQDGIDGKDGQDGIDGQDGADGLDGTNGSDGEDGDIGKRHTPYGVGIDLTVWENDNEDATVENVEIQNKYDLENDDYSVFAVVQLNVWKMFQKKDVE